MTLITTLIVNRVSYKQEYYKMIIEKRIHAYNNIEHLVTTVKSNSFKFILDSVESNRIARLQPLVDDIKLAMSESLWLSKEMKTALNEFDESVLLFQMENFEKIEYKAGSQFHISINKKIKIIEQILKKDMMSIHKVRCFLKNK